MHLCLDCQYHHKSQYLKCAVNPAYRGGSCEDFFAFHKFRVGDRVKLVAFDMPWISPYFVREEAQNMTVVEIVGRMVRTKGEHWPEPVWFRPDHLESIEANDGKVEESLALQQTMVQLLNSIQEKPLTQVKNRSDARGMATSNPFERLR